MTDVRDEVAPAAATGRPDAASGGFIWYELMTPDPIAAKAFYDPVVGWSISPEAVAPGLEYRMIRRSDGGNAGGLLTLDAAMEANGARPCWLGYVAVGDVDATVARATAAGATVRMPAWDQPGVGRLAMIADPQGAPLYLMDPLPPEGDPDATSDAFSVDEPQHIRWNELSTSDPDAAIAFYTTLFGWEQQGEMDMGEMGKYRFIQHDGVGIGAVMPKMPQMAVSMWSYYIGVGDIDRASRAITDGGGTILNGPMEIPGGEFALNALDPQQAAFGLVGPRKS